MIQNFIPKTTGMPKITPPRQRTKRARRITGVHLCCKSPMEVNESRMISTRAVAASSIAYKGRFQYVARA